MNTKELKDQVKFLFEIMGDEEVIDSMTNTTWKIFSKLQEKGFTKEEALSLIIALAQQKGK